MGDSIDRLNAVLEGRYRIDREIGEGGMATVYLADDLRHNRKVAIKVLKPELAAVVGAERFLAEIETTANLQHPHILPLHDSGEADGLLFYVMPYVEGESLRERLDREHQLPVDEAVQIATNVAEALDYAHARGVIHRDIKPANILLQAGKPVVSDFGIALAVSTAGGGRLTETGLSLGTPHYMSPEQATGDLSIGPGSDIYSLGCVLYEMLAGDPPFTGSTAQAILARILTHEPPRVSESRQSVPSNVAAVVSGALEKIPADRFTTAGELARALADPGYVRPGGEGATASTTGSAASVWRAAAVIMSAVAVGLAAGLVLLGGRTEPRPVFRVSEDLEVSGLRTPRRGSTLALSPDGRTLVYAGEGDAGQWRLWVRSAEALAPTPLEDSESSVAPVFSPDGRSLALSTSTYELRLIDLETRPERVVAQNVRIVARDVSSTVDWSDDGWIYYFRGPGVYGDLWRVHQDGGEPERVDLGDLGSSAGDAPFANSSAPRERSIDPESMIRDWGSGDVLPGGRAAVMTRLDISQSQQSEVVAVDLQTGETTPLGVGSAPKYALEGYLFWRTGGDLWAAPFDPDRLSITGDTRRIAEGVGAYAVDQVGSSLVYLSRGSPANEAGLVWVDREGEVEEASELEVHLTVGNWDALALSPDGTGVALAQQESGASQVLVQALAPGTPPRQLTFEGLVNVRPTWTPDGADLIFVSNRGTEGTTYRLFRVPADGSAEPRLVLAAEREIEEGFVSPDGGWLVYRLGGTSPNRDIYARRIGADADTMPVPLAATAANERAPALSGDGRWLAYASDETGVDEIFVTRFPQGTGKWKVSPRGGTSPVWGPDGELFFISRSGQLTSARYRADNGAFVVLGHEELFPMDRFHMNTNAAPYQVAEDGRFLFIAVDPLSELVWVRNWVQEMSDSR